MADKKKSAPISRVEQDIIKAPIKKNKKVELSGVQKVAILMVALGSDVSSSILKNLREDEIQNISREIANVKTIKPEDKKLVLEEFKDLLESGQFIIPGGEEAAKEILSRAFGEDKAKSVLGNIHDKLKRQPFQFLNNISPQEIVVILKEEHPQTIALTLSFIKPELASKVLKELPQDLRSQIAKRIAKMDQTSPEVIDDIEKTLRSKIIEMGTDQYQKVDGVNILAEILNNMDRESEKNIISSIEEDDDHLALEIKEKMFVFENITDLEDREVQKVNEIASNQDLALALKGADSDVQNKILKNISKNRKEEIIQIIKDMGQVRSRDVYAAQQNFLNLLKILEAQGEVYLKSRNSDEFIV